MGRWGWKAAKAVLLLLLLLPAFSVHGAEERAVKTRVAPVYPELAKRMHISGVVKVQATVDADGKVTDVKALSGNSALVNAAEDAVRKWRFVPGEGVSVVEVTVTFAME
ncbi:MAG TPA: energy transducer TonB [Terracidiphilus sp.]|nr:energy transducer TonB [Terracidiphilus sp.]